MKKQLNSNEKSRKRTCSSDTYTFSNKANSFDTAQVEALERHADTINGQAEVPEKLHVEFEYGSASGRPVRAKLLDDIQEGDTVIVQRMSYAADNSIDFLSFARTVQSKGAVLVVLEEAIDTSTPKGKFLLSVFDHMAQLGQPKRRAMPEQAEARSLPDVPESDFRGEAV